METEKNAKVQGVVKNQAFDLYEVIDVSVMSERE